MLEMQAAIGRIQLRRMAQWTAARTANAAVLAQALQPFAGPANRMVAGLHSRQGCQPGRCAGRCVGLGGRRGVGLGAAQAQVLCGGRGFGCRSGCHADSHIGLSSAQRTDAVN